MKLTSNALINISLLLFIPFLFFLVMSIFSLGPFGQTLLYLPGLIVMIILTIIVFKKNDNNKKIKIKIYVSIFLILLMITLMIFDMKFVKSYDDYVTGRNYDCERMGGYCLVEGECIEGSISLTVENCVNTHICCYTMK